jgi:hypothetical protein
LTRGYLPLYTNGVNFFFSHLTPSLTQLLSLSHLSFSLSSLITAITIIIINNNTTTKINHRHGYSPNLTTNTITQRKSTTTTKSNVAEVAVGVHRSEKHLNVER